MHTSHFLVLAHTLCFKTFIDITANTHTHTHKHGAHQRHQAAAQARFTGTKVQVPKNVGERFRSKSTSHALSALAVSRPSVCVLCRPRLQVQRR